MKEVKASGASGLYCMADSANESPLHIPPEFRYECVQCGRSCSTFDEIPIDRESEERINGLNLEALLPSEDRRPPFADSGFVPGKRVLRQVRGHCGFLTLQRKCAIHQMYDLRTKPQACQDFPYRYVSTPKGDFLGLSFACTGVLEEAGSPVESRREWLEANRKRSLSRRMLVLPVRLSDRIPLTWEQYEKIETDLVDLVGVETQPVENRLIAQAVYLRLLEDFVRESNATGLAGSPDPAAKEKPKVPGSGGPGLVGNADAESGPTDPETAPGQAAAEIEASLENVLPPLVVNEKILETFRREIRVDNWGRLFSMAHKRLEQPVLMRAFLGQMVAFRQALGKGRRGRLGALTLLTATYLRHALRMGSLFLEPLPRAVEWGPLRKVKIDFSDPYFAYTVRRFFSHAIWRKDLLLESNLRMAHGFFLMCFGLLRYYTAALTVMEGEKKSERRHLLEGLFNVEKYYMFHSRFNTLFSRYPWWRSSVESVMMNPRFAPTMTRAPL